MRRFVPALSLFLAACAARPVIPEPTPVPVTAAPRPQVRSSILGLTASELVGHFGNPALQVREGAGLKLQFRSPRCVLDAYLYASDSGGGVQRVTYVDTRLPTGAAADQAACISALENPS
ncbi:MAG TPA: hypothetical protein VF079_04115 [Sphingomicrobium sp.]